MVLYTIGHSTHPLSYFLELLQTHGVNCLVDIRSVAGSSYNPQFNKEPFSSYLLLHGITYLHFAAEFGARQTDPVLLDASGQLDFEKVRQSASFLSGVERLKTGCAKGFTIALMCAESDPLECHRFSMVSPGLTDFIVWHILKDGRLASQVAMEERLLKKYDRKLPGPTIFEPVIDRLKAAYRLHNKDIAYAPIRS